MVKFIKKFSSLVSLKIKKIWFRGSRWVSRPATLWCYSKQLGSRHTELWPHWPHSFILYVIMLNQLWSVDLNHRVTLYNWVTGGPELWPCQYLLQNISETFINLIFPSFITNMNLPEVRSIQYQPAQRLGNLINKTFKWSSELASSSLSRVFHVNSI